MENLIPVVGTLAGGIVGFLGSALMEHYRHKREDRTRFDSLRLEVYSALMASADALPHEFDGERMWTLCQRARLLGSEKTRDLADKLVNQAAAQAMVARGDDELALADEAARLNQLLAEFVSAVRIELRIAGTDIEKGA